MLNVENITLIKKDKVIFKYFSAAFSTHQIGSLVGASGAGKSSLLRILAGLETPQEGKVFYGGYHLNQMDFKKRSQVFGFVPQTFSLFPHMNVLDNCAKALIDVFGIKKKDAHDLVMATLAQLEMEPFSNAFPSELSGGQQQRIAIARALVLNPQFLLLDEPTSALDRENIDRLIQLLFGLQKTGKGIIVASHDMEFVNRISNQIIAIGAN